VFFLVKRAGTVQSSLFGSKNGCVVDGCRPAKSCIKKWIHGSANKQPELSAAEEATVKNGGFRASITKRQLPVTKPLWEKRLSMIE
jgi:hypothetical protein